MSEVVSITETLRDLIINSTGCGCCDSASNHADLVKRALARFDPMLWPEVACIPRLYTSNQLYIPIYEALTLRKVTW